jgi:hypothetical protein
MDDEEAGAAVERFGCGACYGEDVPDWAGFARNLERIVRTVDESHFSVDVLRCRTCGQPWVRVDIELTGFPNGSDAYYTTVVPVTVAEADRVITEGEDPDRAALGALGRDRRQLRYDSPSTGGSRIGWATGTFDVWGGM